ncbi:MAG: helix-turn-helix domain-containing protein [Deltaproteobacteria bacterium]|nr:helix-turn-helix domain-containing protein [Deltaproteobacteria bacterium]
MDTSASPSTEPTLLQRWCRLGEQALAGDRALPLRPTLALCRELLVLSAWTKAGGNITRTAARLGVSRKTVRIALRRWRAASGAWRGRGTGGGEADRRRP